MFGRPWINHKKAKVAGSVWVTDPAAGLVASGRGFVYYRAKTEKGDDGEATRRKANEESQTPK